MIPSALTFISSHWIFFWPPTFKEETYHFFRGEIPFNLITGYDKYQAILWYFSFHTHFFGCLLCAGEQNSICPPYLSLRLIKACWGNICLDSTGQHAPIPRGPALSKWYLASSEHDSLSCEHLDSSGQRSLSSLMQLIIIF